MSFLSPIFLAAVLAAGIPVLIHLLKRQPDAHVRFSAVKLLREAPVEHASRRQLRELLLLALRVTALVLLALAFARPFLTSGAAALADGTTVIALDTSMSMSAPEQFERARQLAAGAVTGADRGQVAVVTFSDAAQVVSNPSADRAMATAAIRSATAGAGGTNYRSALTASADLLGGRPGTIVVVTDLQDSGWGAGDRVVLPQSARLEILDAGAPPPNLAVSGARVAGERIVATVNNTGAETRSARISLRASGGLPPDGAVNAGEVTIPVAAAQSADVTFPLPRGRWASIEIDDPRGIPADNSRFLVLDANARPSVLVITSTGDLSREAFYLEQAIAAPGANGRSFDVEGVSGMGLQSWDQARMDRHASIVLLSTRGLEHHGRELLAEYCRKGGGVIVAAGADVDGDVVAEALGGLTIAMVAPATTDAAAVSRSLTPTDARHPVFQPFTGRSSLGLVTFRRVATLRAPDCAPLARFSTGEAAVVDCESGAGRALVLASDLDNRWNDFPRHATFVPFLQEALRYVSGASHPAEFVVGRTPAGVAASPGVALLDQNGVGGARLVAVNVDPAESGSGRLTAEDFEKAVVRTADAPVDEAQRASTEQEERQRLWQYLLLFVIVMLIAESFVAMRTA